ncbi:MAG TPA: zf-HC2 domain-containing protein [Candidatus Acidoferrales bacterium]
MDWNCTLTEDRLSDYLDGTLTREEAAAFESHAAGCAKCAKLVNEVRSLVTRMQGFEQLAVPPMLVTRIVNSTSGPRKESRGFKNVLAWRPAVLQPRFVMGLVTVAATILILLYTTGMTPAHLKHADLSPATVMRTANRQAHLSFAKSVKFVNDLRVVYEIQTRLQPEAEPSPARPTSEENTPNGKPQEKSQTSPHPGHSQARSTALFAVMVGIGTPQGLLN